ncbi:uncharacterized protein [Aegilops tauschii subsp. strangulata]|uniref:uncharacterized protein n=1 Tax=Aegilops tauschii subsp. strangulata TaxID=200361 RepID=UPI00098AED7B|nr:uncharacterized protein LOC109749461 [Aegilops tauschii subsp. strangulata]
MPTFAFTALRIPKKFIKEIDKSRRRFLWAGDEEISGGKCKPTRPWVGTGTPCDAVDRALFAASMVVTIGNGATASFWSCSWLGGRQLCSAYPDLFARAIRKNRSVKEALTNDRWILDLRNGDYNNIVHQVVQLAREIRQAQINLEPEAPDTIKWKFNSSGNYSTSSAYNAQFEGN